MRDTFGHNMFGHQTIIVRVWSSNTTRLDRALVLKLKSISSPYCAVSAP